MKDGAILFNDIPAYLPLPGKITKVAFCSRCDTSYIQFEGGNEIWYSGTCETYKGEPEIFSLHPVMDFCTQRVEDDGIEYECAGELAVE